MRKIFIVSFIMLNLLVNNVPVMAQDQYQENFELVMLNNVSFQNDFRIRTAAYLEAALAPLGINLNIKNVNLPNFVYHANVPENGGFDMLLARYWAPNYELSKYNDIGFEYNLIDHPLMEGSGGVYGLNDEELVNLFLEDTGTDLHNISQMVMEFNNEADKEEKKLKSDYLAQFYLDNVLVNFPLVEEKEYTLISKEFQRINNEYMRGSLMLGAELERKDNFPANILRLGAGGMKDYRPDVFNYLMIFDGKGNPHPDLAIQWEQTDWVLDNNTVIENGKNVFLIRDDVYFEPGAFYETSYLPKKLSLADFEFTYWLNQNSHLWFRWNEPGAFYTGTTDLPERYYRSIVPTVEFNYTANTMTVYNPQPLATDIYDMNAWFLYPETYFNNTILHYEETDGSYTEATAAELVAMGKNPKFTDELAGYYFDEWITTEPYNVIEQKWDEGHILLELRDLYHFPSELDSPDQDFIVHQPGPETPYYFAYNITAESPTQKPTTIPVDTIMLYIDDLIHQRFLDGNMDFASFNPDNGNMDMFEKLQSDQNIDFEPLYQLFSGQFLSFDLSNPHLAKYNVRKAIALAIDKDVLVELQNGEVERWDNSVWLYYQDQYNPNIRIDYDYSKARDLMRNEGYWASETPDFSTKKVIILDFTTIPDEAILPLLPIFVGLGLVSWLRKRK